MTEKLKEISAKQANIKVIYHKLITIFKFCIISVIKQSEEEFSEDLRQFLAIYYKTVNFALVFYFHRIFL